MTEYKTNDLMITDKGTIFWRGPKRLYRWMKNRYKHEKWASCA